MRGELFSIVVSDCFDAVGERQKHARAGLYDRVRALVRQLGELGVFGFTLDMRHHSASVIGTDNCVGLPVSDAAFCGDNGRSLIDVDAVRDQPAARILALPLVVFFAAVTQVKIQLTPVFLVFPDMLIDALVTDTGDAILRQTTADLIRTPLLLRQFLLNQLHQVRRHFAWLVRAAQFRVIVTHRPKYACRACEEAVVQAPAPERLIKGGLPTEAMVASVLVSKYAWRLPLYRQAQMLAAQGLDIKRSTLAFWVGYAAAELRPVFERLRELILTTGKIAVDETKAPVLDPGRGRVKEGYFWAVARDDRPWDGADPPAIAFAYAPGRGAIHGLKLLGQYACGGS